MNDIRIVPTLALTVSAVALLLFVVQNPSAAMWAVVVALVLAVCGLFTLAKESIDLRAESDDKDRKIADLEAEAQRLHLELTERDLLDGKAVAVPLIRPGHLRVIAQRDADHDRLPVADGAFPVHTALDDDDLTALMRATEEE